MRKHALLNVRRVGGKKRKKNSERTILMPNVNGVISPLPANGGEALDRLKENIQRTNQTHTGTHISRVFQSCGLIGQQSVLVSICSRFWVSIRQRSSSSTQTHTHTHYSVHTLQPRVCEWSTTSEDHASDKIKGESCSGWSRPRSEQQATSPNPAQRSTSRTG